MMTVLERLRSPRLTFFLTLMSLLLGTMAVFSPFWCEGSQKVPKPLCSPVKKLRCIQVEDLSNGSTEDTFSWETGDDRFAFPTFHSGLWIACQENILKDAWEEKCRSLMAITPGSERGILWLSVTMEIMYIGLLFISFMLLLLQLCLSAWFPAAERWGQLVNAYSALFTTLAGLLGMVAHMMFMQVFQVTISIGPEDLRPHHYGYSWAFYMAWVAFLFCMSSGISTLNNYTKKVVMNRHKHKSQGYPCRNFTFPPQPPTTHYSLPPPPPSVPPPSPPSPPLSPLSPYYNTSFGDAPSPPLPEQQELQELQEQQQQREHQRERQRQLLQHQASMPPPHPSQQATFCPYYSNAAPSLSISPTMSGHSYTLQYSEEEYSPL
ncbi:germ cell-specific gene 1-like protein [Clupea harengus]|uniref:Germ cell-specific gene 1-like protein n=1 Tax=Clupea harengus TaxID=7950 RepID=A0A6P8FPH1_CLUHA|nr:germ cell-specific gene 1-like protein [Clupea harengus]